MSLMTEEVKSKIRIMWGENKTSSQIAEEIGISRNSVIGAVYRMRKSGENISERGLKRPGAKYKKRKPLTNREAAPKIYTDGRVGILGLGFRTCRFIVEEGDYISTKYCNKGTVNNTYCKHHYEVCYVRQK